MNEFSLPYIIERAHARTLYDMLKQVSALMPDHAFSNHKMTFDEFQLRGLYQKHTMMERIQFLTYRINKMRQTAELEYAFPSSPQRPAQYELRVKRDDGAFNTMSTCAVYPMVKYIQILIGDREWFWINDSTIRCHDLIIKSRHLKRYMTTKLTQAETDWLLPMPYSYHARAIGFNESYSAASSAVRTDPHHDTQNAKPGKTGRTSRSERTSKAQNVAKQPKSAITATVAKPTGTTFGIPELSSSSGLEPSKVRAKLRKATTKPTGGWEFNIDDWEKIIAIVRK